MPLNVLMYHYVRNNEQYEYDVFSRRRDEFEHQVRFISKKYTPCSLKDPEEINFYLSSEKESFILTFDDGYKDHLYCAEFLNEIGLSGIFFPSQNIFEGKLLNVNLLHLLLGKKGTNIIDLLDYVQKSINVNNFVIESKIFDYFGDSIDEYSKKVTTKRFDGKEISGFKFLLQRDIKGDENRKLILDNLFKEYFSIDQNEYSKNFYLTLDEMKKMKKLGSKFGSHGMTHEFLNVKSKKEQEKEIIFSFNKLSNLGLIDNDDLKMISYPFGAYNQDSFEVLKKNNIDYAFTVKAEKARLVSKSSPYKLSRWDTNHFWNKELGEPKIP